jgi:hypothetical protein
VVKQQGGRNDLLERVKKAEFFKVRTPLSTGHKGSAKEES